MAHTGHSSPESQPRWQRWVLAGFILATLIFGCWGYWRHETEHAGGHSVDKWSVLYHAVQLLIGHGAHLEGGVPWQLHWGRFLGLVSLFTAGLLATARFFRREGSALWLYVPLRRPHVVICGLGDLGLRLALDARQRVNS